MKLKKMNKRLLFHKTTIANLNQQEMDTLRAGQDCTDCTMSCDRRYYCLGEGGDGPTENPILIFSGNGTCNGPPN